MNSLLIRPFLQDQWQVYRVLRLRALANAPDAFGSMLATEQTLVSEQDEARVARSATSGTDHAPVGELS